MRSILHKAYHQSQAAAASSPVEQVAILLDRASNYLYQAKECIKNGDVEGRYRTTERALTIVTGLTGIFKENDEDTKSFVQDMQGFLGQVLALVAEINFKNDGDICERAAGSLLGMADIWRQAAAHHPIPKQEETQVMVSSY
jgi:flagellar biosynthetic protein FliS